MKRLNLNMDDDLHRDFKIYAARIGSGMGELIIDFIRGVIVQQELPGKAKSGPKKGNKAIREPEKPNTVADESKKRLSRSEISDLIARNRE